MPSFDIASELDRQELKNALDQVHREIKQRYDFKGSCAEIKEDKEALTMVADDEFRLQALKDLFQAKLIKRNLSPKSFEFEKSENASGNTVRCPVKLVVGIDKERAKELVKKIKDLDLKVQASIQEDKVRVTGKKRDDLQAVMASLRALDYEIPLQFINFRD